MSSQTPSHLVDWYWLSIAMGICFVICIILIILQVKSIKWYSVVMNDNNIFHILIIASQREHICLYSAYVLACLCSIQCLFNHISNHFPPWYCEYGMGACVILHEAAKTFGYGFFLERAKSALRTTKSDTFPFITNYMLPVWISSYFILYSILCPLTFRGLSHNPFKDKTIIPTACLFDEYESWVFFLSVGVEVFNSIFFVILFAYPLWHFIDPQQMSVVNIVKFNIIFSSVSCVSSVTFLFYRALSRNNELAHYLWLAGNIDLVINAICTFLMITANRMYLNKLLKTICKCVKIKKQNEGISNHHNHTKQREKSANGTLEHKSLITLTPLNTVLPQIEHTTSKNRKNDSINAKESTHTNETTDVSLPKLMRKTTPPNLSSTLEYMSNLNVIKVHSMS